MVLPAPLVLADSRLHELHARVAFSTFLNPTNIAAARDRFLADGEPPTFTYAPFAGADASLLALDAISPGVDHPFARLIDEAVAETRCAVVALRNRTCEAFDEWNRHANWYPDPADDRAAALTSGEGAKRDGAPVEGAAGDGAPVETFGAEAMRRILHAALRTRGWPDWTVEFDPVMAARILVDAPRRLMRLNPRARFRASDARGMVAHEIDVHVRRARHGSLQPLHVFATGLAGNLATEEGLAVLAEEAVGAALPHAAQSQALIAAAVDVARTVGFRALYQWLRASTSAPGAWTIAMRLKRGLAEPEEPGVYAKDSVYAIGRRRVSRWLAEGGDPRWFYCGKVGVEHPTKAWVDDGLLVPPPELPAWLPDLVAAARRINPPGLGSSSGEIPPSGGPPRPSSSS